MPVKNYTAKTLFYTYMPSIDSRPSTNISEWYTLEPNSEAHFSSKLQNEFINFWIGTDFPWKYYDYQCTKNLETLWYGPINIKNTINIKNFDSKMIPLVYQIDKKLDRGYGAVTSFSNHIKNEEEEIVLRNIITNRLENVLIIFSITILILFFCMICVKFCE